MRVLVTGKKGQIVTALTALPPCGIEWLTIGRPEVDLTDGAALASAVLSLRPDAIVSVAAYTAVDQAETEPDLAHRINAEAPGILAETAAELNIPLIHLSTDYVFDGTKRTPYVESDATNPVNVYGRTKEAGEAAIRSATRNHVILRTAWVYSPYGHNFVKTMLRLAESRTSVSVVADQTGCPTSATEIARAIGDICRRLTTDASDELRGTFHLAAPNSTHWADFARAIFAGLEERTGRRVSVQPISTAQYPTLAQRPANSQLCAEKLFTVYGIKMPPWQKSLDDCLDLLLCAASNGSVGIK